MQSVISPGIFPLLPLPQITAFHSTIRLLRRLPWNKSPVKPTRSRSVRSTLSRPFSEPINLSTFANADITLGGTAGATTAVITEIAPNNHTTFGISVSGMTGDGTVTASIAANKVRDIAGNLNTASTSSDNTVTFDTSAPTATINQAVGPGRPDQQRPDPLYGGLQRAGDGLCNWRC